MLSTARFQVARGRRTEVRFAPSVFVRGRVTIGPDRPAVGITLLFQLETRSWVATPNEDGEYASPLGDPGEYTITVRPKDGVASVWFNRHLEGKTERADFALSAGELHVRLRSEDGTPPDEVVGLVATRSDGKRITGEREPGQDGAVRFAGLDFGEYVVTASTLAGLTSEEPVTAILSAEAPVAEVELVLGRHEGRLTVVDESGHWSKRPRSGRYGASLPVARGHTGSGRLGGERLVLRAEGSRPRVPGPPVADRPRPAPRARAGVRDRDDPLAKDLRWESGPSRACRVRTARSSSPDGGTTVQYGQHGTSVVVRLPRVRSSSSWDRRPTGWSRPAATSTLRRRSRPRPIAVIRPVAPYPIG